MKVSVVTATYNSESTIGDTLESIDGQIHNPVEHWVIDGKSTDATLEVVERHHGKERYVISEKDSCVYNAMNKGIASATGDIIGFLNADDFYESPYVLADVAEAFSDPEVDLVFGNLRYVDAEDTDKVIRDWVSEPYQSGLFRSGWMPPHPTVYARKRVFEREGGFDEAFSICGDWEWLMRVIELKGYHSRYVDRYFVRMRVGGVSNSSLSNIVKSQRESMAAFRKHGLRFPVQFFPGKLLHRGKPFFRKSGR